MGMERFLAVRPDKIGDVLLITPSLSLLRQKFPSSHIAVWGQPYTREILGANPDVDEIIYSPNQIKKFDCSLHFYNEFPFAYAAWVRRINNRIGDKSKILFGYLYNRPAYPRWSDLTLHEVEHNLALLKPLGIEIPSPPPKMKLQVKNLNKKLPPGSPIVGIHLGTGKGNKAWLPDRYAKVADRLIEKRGVRVVLTGGPGEKDLAEKVLSLCRQPLINMVGQTDLSELIGLISQYQVLISVDTGPLHIAAAVGTPVAAIFATKNVKPAQWGPWQTRHVIVRKTINCSRRCIPRHCPFDDCLREITAEEVTSAVEELLAGGGLKTLDEARAEWYKKSFNIAVNRDEIQRELHLSGYHAAKLRLPQSVPELINFIIKEDINIIHWAGQSAPPLILKLAAATSALWVPIPPLIIHDKGGESRNRKELVAFYIKKFRERK